MKAGISGVVLWSFGTGLWADSITSGTVQGERGSSLMTKVWVVVVGVGWAGERGERGAAAWFWHTGWPWLKAGVSGKGENGEEAATAMEMAAVGTFPGISSTLDLLGKLVCCKSSTKNKVFCYIPPCPKEFRMGVQW